MFAEKKKKLYLCEDKNNVTVMQNDKTKYVDFDDFEKILNEFKHSLKG